MTIELAGGTLLFSGKPDGNGRHVAVGASGGGGETLSFVEEPDFTVTDNGDGTITIQDAQSRFGTRPHQAAPDMFTENDYGLNDGELIPDDPDNPYFGNVAFSWVQRTQSSLKRYDSEPGVIEVAGEGRLGQPIGLSGTDPSYIYGRFWKRFEITPFESANSASHKFVRAWNGGTEDMRVSWTQSQIFAQNNNTTDGSAATVSVDWNGSGSDWNLYEFEIDYSTNTARCWLNGSELGSLTDANRIQPSNPDLDFRMIASWNPANGTAEIRDQKHWNSDIYADRSKARVLLNQFTAWADREASGTGTLIDEEIQPPTAWSAGEITVTKRLGPISAPSGYSLYVIDDSGNVLKAAEVA